MSVIVPLSVCRGRHVCHSACVCLATGMSVIVPLSACRLACLSLSQQIRFRFLRMRHIPIVHFGYFTNTAPHKQTNELPDNHIQCVYFINNICFWSSSVYINDCHTTETNCVCGETKQNKTTTGSNERKLRVQWSDCPSSDNEDEVPDLRREQTRMLRQLRLLRQPRMAPHPHPDGGLSGGAAVPLLRFRPCLHGSGQQVTSLSLLNPPCFPGPSSR